MLVKMGKAPGKNGLLWDFEVGDDGVRGSPSSPPYL